MENQEKPSNLNDRTQELLFSILGDRVEDTYVKVKLPSNGAFYEKEVEIRPYTFEDERQALALNVKSADFMNVLFDRCIKGASIHNMVIIDRNYLIFKIKQISSGVDITLKTKCDTCGGEEEVKIDLSKLPVVDMPEDFETPMTFLLPQIKKEVKALPILVKEEKYTLSFDSLSKNIWRFVKSIHGVEDSTVIKEVISRLPIQDVHAIIKKINLTSFGISPQVNILCEDCGTTTETHVPVTPDFLGMG